MYGTTDNFILMIIRYCRTVTPAPPTFSNNLICRDFKPNFCKKFINYTKVLQLGSQSPEALEGVIAANTFYAHSTGLVSKQCLEIVLRFSCLQTFPQCRDNKVYTICKEDCNASIPFVYKCLDRLKKASPFIQLPTCRNAPSRKDGYRYCISLPNMHMNNMSSNGNSTGNSTGHSNSNSTGKAVKIYNI